MRGKTLIFLFCLLWGWSFRGWAQPYYFLDQDNYVLEQINNLRQNPLAVAQVLGLDLSTLIAKWKDSDNTPVRLLNLNPNLSEMAKAHVAQMIETNTITHSSQDGLTLEQRARLFGYDGPLVGESIIVICFENFISSQDGLNTLLTTLFKDALDQQSAEGAPLLFGLYQDLGVGFAVGTIQVEDKQYNVYLLCLEFGLRNVDGYLVGRVYQKDKAPFPEYGLGGIDVFSWGSNEMVFAHHQKTFMDGSFFLPRSAGNWWWMYVKSEQNQSKLFQVTSPVQFIPFAVNATSH